MKLYLISNNLLLDGLDYDNKTNLELLRILRPLSISGEEEAFKLSKLPNFKDIDAIYSSFHSSAISSAKYLSNTLELDIRLCEELNDCKVGTLGSKNMKMVKGLQDHDLTYKLPNGESLNDVGDRMKRILNKLMAEHHNVVVYTHKRAILGFLLKYAKIGYNLDENLILEYNNHIIYDDSETTSDIYEIEYDDNKLIDIKRI